MSKIAVITGGSSGIGKATAALFARNGYAVYELSRSGCDADGVRHIDADVTKEETLRSAMAAGVVKAVLALHAKVLPPQISAGRSADQVSNLASSAYLLDSERPWITGDSANPRRAAVLGANFDAVNPVGEASPAGRAAAVILEEEPEDRT